MTVKLRTHYSEVVAQIFEEHEFSQMVGKVYGNYGLDYQFSDDIDYYQVNQWASDAIGCGLIYGYNIERVCDL